MRRRDFLVEHVADKTFIEDVMKSVAWTTLCGAVYTISIISLKAGQTWQGLGVFLFFILLTTFSMIYVALHVVIPLDSAMSPKDPYWDDKAKKLKGLPKLWEAVKIFFTRKGIFYFLLCSGYFFYAKLVAGYLVSKS